MHAAVSDLLALLVLLSGSLLMPLLSNRLRIPSAVLLIGFGVLVGPHALGLLHETGMVSFLYEIGFIVLMFLAGMEIDFNGIRLRGWRPMLEMLILCLVIFALAFLAAWVLGHGAIVGLALGATSVGLPLAVLKESGRLRSNLGQTIIVLGSVGEFLTVIGMTLFYLIAHHGFSAALFVGLGQLAAVLAVAALVLRVLVAVAWWRPTRFSNLVDQNDTSEIGVRAGLVLAIAFSSLAALAGVETIVGAFLAGALIAFVFRGKEVLEEKLAAVGHGLFVPIFFLVVGLRFDPGTVSLDSLATAGLLLACTFGVRLVPGLALVRLGTSLRGALATVSLLSAPLTLVVAIAAIGASLGTLDESGQSNLIVLAVLAGVVFPVLFRLLAGPAKTEPTPR
jgi:Kef-type K+ transport system membrane component KefB